MEPIFTSGAARLIPEHPYRMGCRANIYADTWRGCMEEIEVIDPLCEEDDILNAARKISALHSIPYENYLIKLTDAELAKIISSTLNSEYASLDNILRSEKIVELKGRIEFALKKTYISTNQKDALGPLNKLQEHLNGLSAAFKCLHLISGNTAPKIDEQRWHDLVASDVLCKVIGNTTAEAGGYPEIYPPTSYWVEGKKYTEYGAEIRLKRFFDDIEWVKKCTLQAMSDVKSKAKNTPGKSPNIFAESLVIPLANVYYAFTGKIPTMTRTGSTGEVNGGACQFVHSIFHVLGINCAKTTFRSHFNNQVEAYRAGKQIYSSPEWLL